MPVVMLHRTGTYLHFFFFPLRGSSLLITQEPVLLLGLILMAAKKPTGSTGSGFRRGPYPFIQPGSSQEGIVEVRKDSKL